jgi:hypothetical protein
VYLAYLEDPLLNSIQAVFLRCEALPKDYYEITLRSTPLSRFRGAMGKSKVRRFGKM